MLTSLPVLSEPLVKTKHRSKESQMRPDAPLQYYDFIRNWSKRIEPHLTNKHLNEVLTRDFNRYTMGTRDKPFTLGQLPHDRENCDWWLFRNGKIRRGPMPRYWNYVKHGACHWLVNFNLELARLVSSHEEWRIVHSHKHSTVWNSKHTLFDMNFCALSVDPNEAWRLARTNGRVYKLGRSYHAGTPEPLHRKTA